MADALPPGPLRLGTLDVELLGFVGRVGDGLVHDVRLGGSEGRLREYAPPGAAARGPDGRLTPLPGFAAAWAAGCARFLDSARRLQAAALACVPSIRQVGDEVSGAWSISAPAGETLAQILASGHRLPPHEVMSIGRELAGALAAIHAIGVTHLDISPDSVSIAGDQVMLSDFAVDDRAFLRLTGSESGLVRPGYSGIEMYEGAEPLGPTTDVHAASALVFRLMTGADPPSLQERLRDTAPLAIPAQADYPPHFVEAVRRGLAIEPGHRFSDAAAWREAMVEPPGETISVDTIPPPPVARKGGAGWLIVAVAGLIAITAILVTYLVLRTPNGDARPPQAALYVVTGPANVRSSPDPGSRVVGQLVAGDQVRGDMMTATSGERWLQISEGPHQAAYIWARNLALPGAAPPVQTTNTAVAPVNNTAAAPPPPPEPTDAELTSWIAGKWDEPGGCGGDTHGSFYADGRYVELDREGSWRIENGRLRVTITHSYDDNDADPETGRLPRPDTSVTPIRKTGPNRMVQDQNGRSVQFVRC